MAVLARLQDGTRYELLSVHLVGRSTTCQLALDCRLVSASHAQLRWNGTSWEIHDLDSRNGTFVDGEQLDRGERRLLEAGATIAFGDPDEVFELVDDSPPVAHATSASGKRHDMEERLLVLPDAQNPEITIFCDRGRWMAEIGSNGEHRAVSDGEMLATRGDTWILRLPVAVQETAQRQSNRLLLHELGLRFTVSRHQEHIQLTILHDDAEIELSPRVHMDLLYRLAQARLDDQKNPDISLDEQGWIYVSELLHDLGRKDDASGRNLICQHVHQARAQIAGAGVEDAFHVVERRDTVATDRRRRAGQIRIGVKRLEIRSS
jgi:pSer/pThr/pTyr-binding forkhead associated (FHA) protein